MPHPYQDHYFFKAKKDRFLARAVYKLEAVQKKYRLIRPGHRVLDLGAAPGSWLQLTAEIIGPRGIAVGVDIKPIKHPFPGNVVTLQRDIFEAELAEELAEAYGPFDLVLSDMAPSTTGIRSADSARSALLFEQAFTLTLRLIRPRGHFLAKIFQGSEFSELLAMVKRHFERVKVVKPEASRKDSKEIYILAMGFRKTH
jgi:23S rRNA (uridine2552-2'-O)-methyltransferase